MATAIAAEAAPAAAVVLRLGSSNSSGSSSGGRGRGGAAADAVVAHNVYIAGSPEQVQMCGPQHMENIDEEVPYQTHKIRQYLNHEKSKIWVHRPSKILRLSDSQIWKFDNFQRCFQNVSCIF